MQFCERCGIDLEVTGLCIDCQDVSGIRRRRTYRAEQKSQVQEWLAMGIPLVEIVSETGIPRQTISYWIEQGSWERFKWAA